MSTMRFNPSTLPPALAPRPAADAPQARFLLPGQLHVATPPARFSAILGSCVTLCLWDGRRKIGGMNHVLLPDGPADAPNQYRYANVANKALLEQMIAAGSSIHDITARVYGGAAIHVPEGEEAESLGYKNVCATLDFLRSTGIPLMAKETGGQHGRKLLFDLHSGQTCMEEL